MPLITDHIRLPRPQPFGILPIPAGLLILPDAGNNDARLRLQAMAHDTSLNIPQQWAFYPLAEREDWAGVLSQLASAEDDISAYNRFVIAPTIDELSKLRHSLTGELRLLVEVAAYALGLEDTIAEEESLAATLNGELLALALMTAAAAEMERGSDAKAIPILERAIAAARPTSPLFAAQLLGQLGQVCSTQPEPYHSQTQGHLKEALALMQEAPFPSLKADLWMQLGMHYQENAQGRHDWSNEAISAYQEVLRSGLVPEEHRELFALAHNNLGLLFLSRRMSENGRPLSMAIALQSFREGLRLCDQQTQPELHRSMQQNLANALVYLPSGHPEENLAQAIDLYEELLTQRTKAYEPVVYGRILANQANALAHLGSFPPALEKLQEARKLFEWHGEGDLAKSAMELVEQIHEQIGAVAGKM